LDYSISNIVLIFVFYAFLGWCIEVVESTFRFKRFINRGFLNGPICPVYGFGVLVVLSLLSPFKDSLPILFLGSIVVTSSVEFITGFILERSFNQKWWDYSNQRFNLSGYISLWTSLAWGVSCLVLFYFLQPNVDKVLGWIPDRVEAIVVIFAITAVFADFIVTVSSLFKIKQRMRLANEISKNMKALSDNIGQKLSNNTISAIKINEYNLNELKKLSKKYQTVIGDLPFGYRRLTKAFPRLKIFNNERDKNKK